MARFGLASMPSAVASPKAPRSTRLAELHQLVHRLQSFKSKQRVPACVLRPLSRHGRHQTVATELGGASAGWTRLSEFWLRCEVSMSAVGSEVVDGLTADGGRCVVLGNPLRDGGLGAARAPTGTTTARGDEVVDVASGHVCLELGEREVAAVVVEAADGHDGVTIGGELEVGGALGAEGGGDPAIRAIILLQRADECAGGAEATAPAAPRISSGGRTSGARSSAFGAGGGCGRT